jgi:hypothetical protein
MPEGFIEGTPQWRWNAQPAGSLAALALGRLPIACSASKGERVPVHECIRTLQVSLPTGDARLCQN